ncbi:amidohydrolase [Sphingomonas oleivorans]|uniref:Amidohydrolase n=1 Tax=Sphingomonas oleivorans TaxID=1735121 RepID=A0A2T5G2B9_9SPHN|nr:amidohydrolase family protein [Sphingomonas oleivorans]PTQ13270.1 amidohydrolase [Sphingomonas oleivorans]
MNSKEGISRRTALIAGGAAIALTGATPTAGRRLPSPKEMVELDEATNIAIATSPDGKWVAFDQLGILWIAPVSGGAARRLTDDFGDIAQPDWSPDGTLIAFQSYRSGNFHIWTIAPDGSRLRQLTHGQNDHREIRYSPDGRSIAFSSDRPGRYAIHVLDVATGAVRMVSQGNSQDSEPAWSRDGTKIAYVADGTRLMVMGLDGAATMVASVKPSGERFRPVELRAPSFGPDGALHYTVIENGEARLIRAGEPIVSGEDVYPFRVGWLPDGSFLYGASGKLRRKSGGGAADIVPVTISVPVTTPDYAKKHRDFTSRTERPVVGISGPVLSPDGRCVAFRALNDIWTMEIGKRPERLIADASFKCDPAWSPDGRYISYSSDRGGTLDIWLRDLAAGTDRQLTNLPDSAAVWGSWSQDGSLIAFINQEGAVHTVSVATGAVQRVYDALWEPGRPSFGPGARTIAIAAFKPIAARYREGLSEILTIDRATGKGSYAPVAPFKSLSTRGDDGPVWSPDGSHIAYVMGSTLWVVPVDATGAFTGAPRQLTTEVTDAPSWSGDSKTLLYLSNGKLRLVPLAGGAPRTVPVALGWANARPEGRTIVRAGRLWDSSEPRYKRDVDIMIESNRILSIMPHGGRAPSDANAKLIDASGLTVLPGLIDMHTHRQMAGYGYGDRMGRIWLAMGITATRSLGAPAYQMVEDREAIDSGARIAPRHYATGEAIDGSRIFYNFMRPVTEPGQMALELSRAEALSYDMVKAYVRLPHSEQAKVIAAAHDMGVHISSHYHYPALNIGSDCMEHLGATSRYGYSRTVTALGAGYKDVTRLFAKAKAGRTPTLFSAGVLLGEDSSLADDPRIRTLFPPWEYAKLQARVKAMREGDRAPLLAALERNIAQIRDTLAQGWHVISGTDAPIDFVAVSLHLNLRAMARFGVSTHDVLLSATRHSGDFLDEPVGRIAPGALADLIAVEGDPLARIEDLAAIRQVMANGIVHTIDGLMKPFAKSRQAEVENRMLPPITAAHQHYWWQDAHYVESSRAACCAGHLLQAEV